MAATKYGSARKLLQMIASNVKTSNGCVNSTVPPLGARFSISIEIRVLFFSRILIDWIKLKQINMLRFEMPLVLHWTYWTNNNTRLNFFFFARCCLGTNHRADVCDASICHVMIFPLFCFNFDIVLFHRRLRRVRLSACQCARSLKNWLNNNIIYGCR